MQNETERITDFIIALSPHNRERGIDMIDGLVKAERIKARIEERGRIAEDIEQMIQKERFSGAPYALNALKETLLTALTQKE